MHSIPSKTVYDIHIKSCNIESLRFNKQTRTEKMHDTWGKGSQYMAGWYVIEDPGGGMLPSSYLN
jgi:hypothetical protein